LKKWNQPAALLFLLLAGSALAMTALGLGLKYTVARSSEQIQETMAIAVPFVLLRGDIALDLDEPDDTENTPPSQEPEETTPPDPSGEAVIPPEPNGGTQTGGEPTPNPGDLSQTESSFQAVEESYFDTALFIGDSRTVGMANYGRLGKADYFADVGMSMFNLFEKTVSDKNFSSQSLRSLLQTKQYETIYLMLGINEIGYPTSSLEKKLSGIVNELKVLQPNATIVLQANLAVTQAKASKNQVFSLEKIHALNNMIASYADSKTVFYLDVNPYFADANGYLRADATSDGVHPYAEQYKNWALWIKEHAVVK